MTQRLSFILLAAIAVASTPAFAKPKESLFYSFGVAPGDAQQPWGLTVNKAGIMYGAARFGGQFNKGAIYSLTTGGVETVLYSFGFSPDGTQPKGAPAIDKNGNLFGTTSAGGTAGSGTIFELSPNGDSYTEQVLYNFCSLTDCADGSMATSSLTIGPKGELYGVTPFGGAGSAEQNDGVLFRLDPPKKHKTVWTETILHTFCDQASCADGTNPYNAPVLASDGFLYGTAYSVLYRVRTDGNGFEILHTFTGAGGDGISAEAPLTNDSTGLLYGTTGGGGTASSGTVFSFDPSTSAYNIVYDFDGAGKHGQGPISGVTIVKTKTATTFYGTLGVGTTGPTGAIYSLEAPAHVGDPWTEQVIHDFCKKELCPDGDDPTGDRLVNIKGTIYGTAIGGGDGGDGVIFKYGKK